MKLNKVNCNKPRRVLDQGSWKSTLCQRIACRMFFGVCFGESLVRKPEVGRGETDPLQQSLAVPSEVQGQLPVRGVAARYQQPGDGSAPPERSRLEHAASTYPVLSACHILTAWFLIHAF